MQSNILGKTDAERCVVPVTGRNLSMELEVTLPPYVDTVNLIDPKYFETGTILLFPVWGQKKSGTLTTDSR